MATPEKGRYYLNPSETVGNIRSYQTFSTPLKPNNTADGGIIMPALQCTGRGLKQGRSKQLKREKRVPRAKQIHAVVDLANRASF